jgi:hypothetical protein
MTTHHIAKPDETIRKIVSAAFPQYKGRTFKLCTDIPTRLTSYWSGGSKDYYCFYELATGKALEVASNHPFFEADRPRDLELLPPGLVLVKHSISMGKDTGITIYANAVDLTPMLPEKAELGEDERTVLSYTRSYKSSYAGIKNYRFHEARERTGITLERWEAAKASLIDRKLLNKRGAITASGRNALGDSMYV